MAKLIIALAHELHDLRQPTVNSVVTTVKNIIEESSHQNVSWENSTSQSERLGGRDNSNPQNSPPVSPEKLVTSNHRDQVTNVYLLVSGSKRHASHIDVNNRRSDRSEWDKAWTSGEQFFSEVCHEIGMNSFGPKTGLKGQLIDVGPNDGLREIANEIWNVMSRKQCNKISKIMILLPPHMLQSRSNVKNEMETVRNIFFDVWTKKDGNIMANAEMCFVGGREVKIDEAVMKAMTISLSKIAPLKEENIPLCGQLN